MHKEAHLNLQGGCKRRFGGGCFPKSRSPATNQCESSSELKSPVQAPQLCTLRAALPSGRQSWRSMKNREQKAQHRLSSSARETMPSYLKEPVAHCPPQLHAGAPGSPVLAEEAHFTLAIMCPNCWGTRHLKSTSCDTGAPRSQPGKLIHEINEQSSPLEAAPEERVHPSPNVIPGVYTKPETQSLQPPPPGIMVFSSKQCFSERRNSLTALQGNSPSGGVTAA